MWLRMVFDNLLALADLPGCTEEALQWKPNPRVEDDLLLYWTTWIMRI